MRDQCFEPALATFRMNSAAARFETKAKRTGKIAYVTPRR